MVSERILLLGPMGAGKSTIGKILSKEFGWDYFDNDTYMAELFGLTVATLSTMPITELHKWESRYIQEMAMRPAPFISGAAGSVVDTPEIRLLLKKFYCVYLRIPLEKVLERAGKSGVGRQALTGANAEILRERYLRRDPLYKECSKIIIELSNSAESDAQKIIEAL
jgi:shikimate kinase